MTLLHPALLPPGTVVSVKVTVGPMTVEHPGLVTDSRGPDGLPTVINASKRRDRRHTEETWSSFTEGAVATVVPMPSAVPVPEMLRRARADLGRPWDLFAANCEHAIARWRGLRETSPQLVAGVALTFATVLVVTALVATRR